MEGKSYTSCIKINGVPILPPLMTKDVIDEMRYYKSLAIAVEKRLAELRTANHIHDNSNIGFSNRKFKSANKHNYSINDNIKTDDTATDIDISPTITTVIHIPSENGNNITDSDISIRNSNGELETNTPWSANSDEENTLESETYLASSTASRSQSLSMNTDLNHSSHDTVSIKSNTAEYVSETCKPQVPKTLDIVPLSLDRPDCKSGEIQSEENGENLETTPKLVRQGSYVLDSPSPMLLAHMQSELVKSAESPSTDYIPTNSSTATRRKEWNIAQAKVQWEQCPRGENIVATEYGVNGNKGNRTDSFKSEPCYRRNRDGKCDSSFSLHSTTKSVDCIQAMLAKEYIAKACNTNYNHKHTPASNSEGAERIKKSKTYDDCSALSLAQKLGGSLGNLSNVNSHIHRSDGDHYCQNLLNNAFKDNRVENAENRQKTKVKSSITTEKLLLVYNEIQKMHKNQMTELVSRQQAEQTLLQKEFEKQQLLLLNEIKKSFPKLPITSLAEQLTPVTPGESVSENGSILGNGFSDIHSQDCSNTVLSQNEEIQTMPIQDIQRQPISCPLDYIYPASSPAAMELYDSIKHTQSTQTPNLEPPAKTYLETVEKDESVCQKTDNLSQTISERKRLNVSRELFPLDCKTVHVPVLGNGVYDDKHIGAANVINAYTRGYLVRRMMQTARVIALKNTYKEALHCMLKLHVDAPLNRSEYHFLHRLQLQCDAASMNIVELFAQSAEKRMQLIAQDRELKRSRAERPTSARSYSFATQRTLARKKLKEMGDYRPPSLTRSCSSRSRCQTWTSDIKEKLISPIILHQTIKRSTSAGTVRKPWR